MKMLEMNQQMLPQRCFEIAFLVVEMVEVVLTVKERVQLLTMFTEDP